MMLFTVRGLSEVAPEEMCKHEKKLYVAIDQSNDLYFCPHCKFNIFQVEIV